MKLFIYLTLFLVFNFSYGQEFKLKPPNLEAIQKLDKASKEPIFYLYFKHHYKTRSQYDLVYDENYKGFLCSFVEDFEKGIVFYKNECSTNNDGLNITINLPKTTKESVIQWIEQMYKALDLIGDTNVWNTVKTRYTPADFGAGCYFTIEEGKFYTDIKIYWGST